jgi:small conductance mechanosensitive channel
MNELAFHWETMITLAMSYFPKVLLAIVTLVIGAWLIKRVAKAIRKLFEMRKLDASLIPFLTSIISVTLYIMLFISVATMVGIATTSFIAVLGAAGLAVGLALQGSLSNFAGGVLILIFKPFKVSDVIEAQGVIAQVTEIQIFHTILRTYDNKTIILPNGSLHNDKIINYSTEPTRRVEWVFGISYNDDVDKAKEIIRKVVFTDPRVLNPDEPWINLAELGNSSLNIKVRALVNGPDFWDVFFDMNGKVKKAFDAAGITIPFPQRDVHLYHVKEK